MSNYQHHIFICTNLRAPDAPRGCCKPEGAPDLHQLFKEKVGALGLKATVRANKAGCLDQCEHGPNVVVYPEAVWYGKVTPADVDVILEQHIIGGKPVERLRIAESCINNKECPHRKR